MRKQGYVIIGMGMVALAGIFWLAHLGKEKAITARADKTENQAEEMAEAQKEKKHAFAEFVESLPSALETLTEDDTEAEAKRKKWEIYLNRPHGNRRETILNGLEIEGDPELTASLKAIAEEDLKAYESLDAQGRALADLGDWILRQEDKRSSTQRTEAYLEAQRTTISFEEFRQKTARYEKDKPASFATIAEAKAKDAISRAESGWAVEPEPWQEVAAFLRDRRDFSQTELDQGDPADPNWHADHIEWIEQTAQTIGIPLDNPEDESWIAEKIAAAKEQRYQDLDAPLIEELKKIDEEMAAAAEAWAREPDGREKEVATRRNQIIKQDKQWRAQREHERRYREEMARNPVFKEMELERQRKERRQARQAEKQAQETPDSTSE